MRKSWGAKKIGILEENTHSETEEKYILITMLHWSLWSQGRENIGDGYIQQSGLLPLAEANNIVMLFPQVINLWTFYQTIFNSPLPLQIKQSWLQGNPAGCWNFWGYLGDQANYQYATKEGYQLEAVARLVERVANISMF